MSTGLLRIDNNQRKALAIATVAALVVSVWFLRDYILLILLAAVATVLFTPVYNWFLHKGVKRGSAASYTFLISVLVVIIPLVVVSTITVFQIERMVSTLTSGNYPQDISRYSNDAINSINNVLADAGVSYRLSMGTITNVISNGAEKFGKTLVNGLLSSVTGFFSFITMAIIYIYVFLSMNVHRDKIMEVIKKLNPLGDKASELYIGRINAMTKATVRGQFVIALCQGTISAAVIALMGLNDLFFFLWMLLTVLSVIPLGAGIVTIPIGIGMMLTGNIWQGAVVILNHLLIVTNIDNVLRPKLVPAEAKLDSALMILAVFAGLGMFGFFGIVIGPVLMIIITTTLQMYLEVFKDTSAIEQVLPAKKKPAGFLRWKQSS